MEFFFVSDSRNCRRRYFRSAKEYTYASKYSTQFTRASRSRKSMKNGSVLFFFKTLADDVNF